MSMNILAHREVYDFDIWLGHLCVPYKFAHIPPADSLYPPVRAVVVKA